jgi:hypothetical protein
MTDRTIVVTCIQEKLDNSRLTVRLNGKVIGYVLQDAKQKWIVRTAPPPPEQVIRGSLQAAVEWLYAAETDGVMTPEPVSTDTPTEARVQETAFA